jgi:hypothetical protein
VDVDVVAVVVRGGVAEGAGINSSRAVRWGGLFRLKLACLCMLSSVFLLLTG